MKEHEIFAPIPHELTSDYVYEFHGLWEPGGVCRIQVYESIGRVPIVIATELPENRNTSITNLVECLAAEILERHFPERVGQLTPMAWVEHYPERPQGATRLPEDFALVTFARAIPKLDRAGNHWRKTLGTPAWKHLERDVVALMIGRPLPHDVW